MAEHPTAADSEVHWLGVSEVSNSSGCKRRDTRDWRACRWTDGNIHRCHCFSGVRSFIIHARTVRIWMLHLLSSSLSNFIHHWHRVASKSFKGEVHQFCTLKDIHSWATHPDTPLPMERWVKFQRPQNLSGSSRQISAAAISETSEAHPFKSRNRFCCC